MTALLVIIGSLFAVGCLVGFFFYRADLTEERQRIPSDQDWQPDVEQSETDVLKHRDPSGLDP